MQALCLAGGFQFVACRQCMDVLRGLSSSSATAALTSQESKDAESQAAPLVTQPGTDSESRARMQRRITTHVPDTIHLFASGLALRMRRCRANCRHAVCHVISSGLHVLWAVHTAVCQLVS